VNHLELLVMVNPEGPLSDDEARLLFDEHIEGLLEDNGN